MKKALVTGASGFIGRALCARLQVDGWEVVALGRRSAEGPWSRWVEADVANAGQMAAAEEKMAGPLTAVFHLAGKAHALAELKADLSEYDRINAEGTRQVLALARRLECPRLVLASTIKAMGEGQRVTQTEADAPAPESPYGKSKLRAEEIVLREGGPVEAAVLRLAMVYGGKERGNMTRMVEAVRRHRFPPFPETGNRRAMVHVADVVTAFFLAAEHPRAAGEVFIVTDGELYSTRELYLTIRRALGWGPPKVTPPLGLFKLAARAGDVLGKLAGRRMPLDSDSLAKLTDSAAFSCEKLQRTLGFAPQVELEDGIRRMVG